MLMHTKLNKISALRIRKEKWLNKGKKWSFKFSKTILKTVRQVNY
jgi:hypothetical protein